MSDRLVIFGGGGHGEVIADSACLSRRFGSVEIFDDKFGPGRDLESLLDGGPSACAIVVGIGDNTIRLHVAGRLKEAGFTFASVVHPSAVLAEGVRLGDGTVVMAGAVINVGTETGGHCIINTRASVDHHCRLGEGVHICPGATLAGNVSIGRSSLIGTGAAITPGIQVGVGVRVGAGAAVVRDIHDNRTVKGVPAR